MHILVMLENKLVNIVIYLLDYLVMLEHNLMVIMVMEYLYMVMVTYCQVTMDKQVKNLEKIQSYQN